MEREAISTDGIELTHDIHPDRLQGGMLSEYTTEQLVECRWQWIKAANDIKRTKGAGAYFDSELAVCLKAIAIIETALMPITTRCFGPTIRF